MLLSLKAARVNAGYTQKAAADELGISKGTLASYELYRTKPDIDTAKAMAALYGVPVDALRFSA